MINDLISGKPAFDVYVKHGTNQVLCLHRRITPILLVELNFAAQDLIEQFVDVVGFAGERRIAGENDEHDHAGTPHVNLFG